MSIQLSIQMIISYYVPKSRKLFSTIWYDLVVAIHILCDILYLSSKQANNQIIKQPNRPNNSERDNVL